MMYMNICALVCACKNDNLISENIQKDDIFLRPVSKCHLFFVAYETYGGIDNER